MNAQSDIVTPTPLVLIHGFAQLPESWRAVQEMLGGERVVISPRLRGHGSDALAHGEPTFGAVRDDLRELLDQAGVTSAVLWGYSQGARVALDFAISEPARVAGLVLESGTAGIEDETKRNARQVADAGLADWITQHSPDEFAAHWENQPIFAHQTPEAIAEQRAIRASHDPMALASALRGLGQAAFDPVWDRLHEIKVPALLLTGSRDEQYTRMATRMSHALPDAHHVVVIGAGHSVHLECPEESVDEVVRFLGLIDAGRAAAAAAGAEDQDQPVE
jgi:2-succinyl-6-hydroxy-2,4-cyclohexadiene-1-carboxylate synthase